jgi:4-amino-4-deoxy-L-arabinose transferase-like glycosyltransferase
MLGLHLDVIPVSIMEARNFITSREMINDGNWLLTTMNGEPRYQKPPLPSWICAGFALLFGVKNIFAYRLPAILFIAITGIFTFLLSKQLTKSKSQSINNALILVTSFYIIGIVFEAPSDIFTHGFMLMGIYALFQLFQTHRNYLKHGLIAGICIGGSILSKGPVSFYVLLLPFLLAYGFSFKFNYNKRIVLTFALCIVLAFLIGGSWYLYVRLEDPETFKAIAEKETGNWSNYNVRPFYYYWSFFTQSGLWTIPACIGLLFPYMKRRVSNLKAYKFSFYWTIFAVILLSIIPEKKSRYLMPVLIPLAINTGFYIEYLITHFKTLRDKKDTLPVYFNFGLIALIAISFPIVGYVFLGEKLDGYWILFSTTSLICFTIGITLIFNLKKKNMIRVFHLTILFFVSILVLGLPFIDALKTGTYKPLMNLKAQTDTQQITVYSYNGIAPEMIWQFGGKLLPLKTDGHIRFPEAEQFGMLAYDINAEDLKLMERNYTIKKLETYDLNLADVNSKSHNDRLTCVYYKLTKR